MSAVRGIVVGALALSFLEAVLVDSPQDAPGTRAARFGGLIQLGAKAVNHLVDPAVPLIPDLSTDHHYAQSGQTPWAN